MSGAAPPAAISFGGDDREPGRDFDPGPAASPLPIRPQVLAGAAAGLCVVPILSFALAVFGSDAVDERPALLVLPLLAGLAVFAMAGWPTIALLSMIAGLFVFPIQSDLVSLPLGFMRVYVHDVIAALAWLLALERLSRTGWPEIRCAVPVALWLWLAYGVLALVIGLMVVGHGFDRAFGDFRRSFVYLSVLVALLAVFPGADGRGRLERWLLGACGALIALGLWQAATGQFYTRRFTDAAHILSKYELQFVAFGVLMAVWKLSAGVVTAGNLYLAAAGTLVTILGNFRSAWLSLLGGLLVVFLYLPMRLRLALAGYSLVLGVLSGGVLGLAWNVPVADGGSTLGDDIIQKFDMRNARYDPNVTWRMESYASAWRLWEERPWLGQGLGVLTEFSAPTSTGGAMLVRGHRVHNSLLWVLMSFGVVGSAVFLWWLGSVLALLHRGASAGDAPLAERTRAVVALAFVASFLISTVFEIFLESGPTVMMLAAVLALGSGAAAAARTGGSQSKPVGRRGAG